MLHTKLSCDLKIVHPVIEEIDLFTSWYRIIYKRVCVCVYM